MHVDAVSKELSGKRGQSGDCGAVLVFSSRLIFKLANLTWTKKRKAFLTALLSFCIAFCMCLSLCVSDRVCVSVCVSVCERVCEVL